MATLRHLRLLVLALLLAASGQLGNSCTGGGPTTPNASIVLEEFVTIPFGNGFVSLVRVYADASLAYQAYDVDFQWNAGPNMVGGVFRAGDFSDDSGFVRLPVIDQVAGTMVGMLDARHGPDSAISGANVLADVFFGSFEGDPLTITASGVIARADGVKFNTAPAAPLVLVDPGP